MPLSGVKGIVNVGLSDNAHFQKQPDIWDHWDAADLMTVNRALVGAGGPWRFRQQLFWSFSFEFVCFSCFGRRKEGSCCPKFSLELRDWGSLWDVAIPFNYKHPIRKAAFVFLLSVFFLIKCCSSLLNTQDQLLFLTAVYKLLSYESSLLHICKQNTVKWYNAFSLICLKC